MSEYVKYGPTTNAREKLAQELAVDEDFSTMADVHTLWRERSDNDYGKGYWRERADRIVGMIEAAGFTVVDESGSGVPVSTPTPEQVEAAKDLLTANGYVAVKEKSYRAAQERQRIAERLREAAEDNTEGVRAWAVNCCDEERRLRERLTFVYGVARAHGATVEELRGNTGERVDAVVKASNDWAAARALLAAAETPEPGYMIKTGDETKLEVLEDGTLRCPTCEASYIPDGLAVPGVDGEPR